jgi:hypothetical protein
MGRDQEAIAGADLGDSLAAKRERCGFKDEAATYLSPLIYFMCLYR